MDHSAMYPVSAPPWEHQQLTCPRARQSKKVCLQQGELPGLEGKSEMAEGSARKDARP